MDKDLGQPGFVPITREQWEAKLAPSPKQLDAVATWAKAQGLTATTTNSGSVQVTGTTAVLASVFQTPINDYNTPSGVAHSNAKNISVPKSLPIKTVLGLENARLAFPFAGAR